MHHLAICVPKIIKVGGLFETRRSIHVIREYIRKLK